jgi:hypothetical protein
MWFFGLPSLGNLYVQAAPCLSLLAPRTIHPFREDECRPYPFGHTCLTMVLPLEDEDAGHTLFGTPV